MADENQFKVVLGADSSQLKAALNDAFKSVQDFAIRVSKLPQVAFSTQGIDNYKKSVAQLKSEVNQLSLQNLNRELININSTVAKANLEGVRIRIDADTSQLQKSLTFANTEIGKLRAERISISADIKPLEASLSAATKEVQDFAISVRKIPQVAFSTGGIDNYKKSVAQLKSEVANLNLDGFARDLVTVNTAAARANLDTIKITVEGNTLPLQKALTAATGLVDQFGVSAIRTSNQTESSFQSIAASAVSLQTSLKNIPNAFDQIESGSTNLSNVKTALDSAAGNAIKAASTFERFGQQASAAFGEAGSAASKSATGYSVVGKSINDLSSDLTRLSRELKVATNPADADRLKNSILQINAALANAKAQGRLDIIDPKTTIELNSASTALANMGRVAGSSLAGINESLDIASGKALQAANTFEGFGQRIVSAISQFSATRGSLNQITAAINEAELAAQQAGKSFLNIGVSVPSKQIDLLRNNVATLKAELASGFRPIINVVDPKTPALLNSVSAALVNIGPATDVVNAALTRTGSNVSNFATSVNKSIADSTSGFAEFKNQAVQLGGALDRIKTLGQLEQDLKRFKTELRSASDPAEIIRLNQTIAQTSLEIKNLKGLGIIKVDANTTALQTSMKSAVGLVDQLGISGNKVGSQIETSFKGIASSASTLSNNLATIPAAIDNIGAFQGALENINKTVDASADKALKAGAAFATMGAGGGRLPLEDIEKFKNNFRDLQKDLAAGFQTKITLNTSSVTRTLGELKNDLIHFKSLLQTASDPKAIESLNRALDKTNAQIKNLKGIGVTSFTGLQKGAAGSAVAVSNVGRSLNQVKPGASAAGQSMTDLNRIVQDVPFGFIGIQNNIQPLFDSFSRLKAETGSTGKALKAMAGSLIGPAGIGLAIAAVSSAIVIFQNGIGGFNKKTKEAAEKVKEFNDSLRSTDEIVNEAFGSVQGQISAVNALAEAIQDTNKPYADRKRALEELQKINKAHFGDLKLEGDAFGALTTRVEEYTKALIAGAVVKGFEQEITRISQELNNQNTTLAKLRDNYKRTEKAVTDFENRPKAKQVTAGSGLGISTQALSAEEEKIRSAAEAAKKAFFTQRDAVDKLGGAYGILEGQIRGATTEMLKTKAVDPLKQQTDGAKKGDLALTEYNRELELLQTKLADTDRIRESGLLTMEREREALQDQLKVFDLLKAIDVREVQLGLKPKLEIDPSLFQLQITQAYEDFQARLKGIFVQPVVINPNLQIGNLDFFEKLSEAVRKQTEAKEIGINIPLNISITGESNVTAVFDKIKKDINKVSLEDAFKPMTDKMIASAQEAKESIETGIVATFSELDVEDAITGAISNIGESLGRALATGINPFVAVAESFLQALGSVVQAFGQRIVALAIAMKITKEAITKAFTNPAVAIAAGAALVILGGVLKNIKFNVPGAAQGATLTGPSSGYLALLHGTEVVSPIGKYNEMVGGSNVIAGDWIIKGTDLVFIQRETLKKRGRM